VNVNSLPKQLLASAAWLLLVFGGSVISRAADSQPANGTSARAGSVTAKFDKVEIKTTSQPGVGVVDLCYEFTNTGDFPLAVEGFTQSCGCMAGEWDGVPVNPGSTGKIIAKFLTQGLRGTVSKHLGVKFVASGSIELAAEVTIPDALIYSAQTLHWTIGEVAKPQHVDIAIGAKSFLRVLSVSANDPTFSCELITIKESENYRVVITPNDTLTERVCVLQVRTDSKDPRDALHGLFALVEKPKAEGGKP